MSTLAWHFVGNTLRDGRPIPPDGEWLTHEGEVKICRSGLHASERIVDAIQFAPGFTLCRVQCEEIVDREHDKLVCRRRKILWRVAAEHLLRDFARRCAWSVLHLWAPPDVVRSYLRTGDPELRAAAWAAARDAAMAAARAAARDAARAAAWDAAWAAAWDEQNMWITDAVERLHGGEYSRPLPEWEQLPEKIQHAWTCAAAWVAGKVTGNHDWQEPLKDKQLADKDAEIERLRDTLLHLYDAQNGPPLHTKRDIEFWEEAMSKARNLLHNAEGGEE